MTARAAVMAVLLAAVSMTLPLSANAQSSGASADGEPFKIFAVVWRGETEVEDGFRDYLNQRGIKFDMTVRNLALDRDNAPGYIEEIREAKPDLVYTWGTGTTSSIFGRLGAEDPDKYVSGVPGLFVLVAYPKGARIVETYEKPGRSVTGVAFLAGIETQLNALLAYRPFKKIAVIYDDSSGNSRANVAQLQEAVPELGIELLVMPIPRGSDGKPDPETLPDMVRDAKRQGADLLYMGPDSFIVRYGDAYTSTAIEVGLPTFSSTQAPLKNSRAMFGLVTDYHTLGKLAGVQAERILVEGKRPEEVPVARLSRFKLWINMDVVHEVGLYPPMNMIPIADFTQSKTE